MQVKRSLFLITMLACFQSYGQTVNIHSITNTRQADSDGGYTLDGVQMSGCSRPKLLNTVNFGSAGIYDKDVSIADGFGTTGSLTAVSLLPPNDIFFFGAFNKLAFSIEDFTEEEIDSLHSWSLSGGKMIITTGGVYSNYYDSNILNEKWGFSYELGVPSYIIPTVDGAASDVFNGPFGSISAVGEGGTAQGYFDTLTSNSKVLAMEVHGNPTLFMDCNTLDLVIADVDAYTSVGGVTPGTAVTSMQDKFWANTIVFMDRLQPPPQITNISDTLTLNASYNSYQWYFNDTAIDSAINNNYFISGKGNYYVEVTVNGGCKIKSKIIRIGDDTIVHTDTPDTLLLPNVFTPNNDGKNDFFIPVKNNGMTINQISIYNRWGNLIHAEESPLILWDGKVKEEIITCGVYYWVIEYQDSKGIKGVMKGFIQLVM